MAQQHPTNEKEQKNRIRTWGIVVAIGLAGGILTGLILSLISWLFIIQVSVTGDSRLESNQYYLMTMIYIAMMALGGFFVAQRTGRGTKSGVFYGLLSGPIAALLMILSNIEVPYLFPALRMYIDPNASTRAWTASWDSNILFVLTLIALPTSFISGPALGALGARIWTQTHRHPVSPDEPKTHTKTL